MKDKKKKNGLKIYIVVPAVVGVLCVAAIVIAIIMGAPEKVNAARVGKQLDLGNKYLSSAEYDKAEVAFSKSLKIDPKSVEAATGMAKVYNKKNQPENAVKYLKKASDNITTPEQATEVQNTLNDTKQQIGNSAENNKEIEKISEKIIYYYIGQQEATVTPTVPVSEDTDQDSNVPGLDFNAGDGENSGTTQDQTENQEPTETPDQTEIPDSTETPDSSNNTDSSDDLDLSDTLPSESQDASDPSESQDDQAPSESQEEPEIPQPTEQTDIPVVDNGTAVPATAPEEILNDYETNSLPLEIPQGNFIGTSISYTYGDGSTAATAMTGRLTEKQQDLDGDGIPELLAVEMQSGKIGFRIYKVNNGAVEMTASQTISAGMENAVESVSYSNTQVCFLMNNNGIYEIGLASYCLGYDAGEGIPAVRTNVEVYSVCDDGSVSLCASGFVQNGEGQESFSGSLAPAGMNGSWNSSNAETLQSMGYAENPYQDATGVPDPLSGGIASVETGAEDLIIVKAEMSAESGVLNVR